MIAVKDLKRTFGNHSALSGLTFDAAPGCVVGLLGRNGAGKTTCLRILAGTLRPTSGSVSVAGIDALKHPAAARAKVGYLSEATPLYPELRVDEYLAFRSELKGIARKLRADRVRVVLSLVNAEDVRYVRIGQLSRGYQKRVSLADALLADPEVLLLDEPTAGLDPTQNRETRGLIANLGSTRTVLVSTHILSEVEAMCGRAIVIDGGKLVAAGSLDELRALRKSTEVEVELHVPGNRLEAWLSTRAEPYERVQLDEQLFRLVFSVPPPLETTEFAEQLAVHLVQAGLTPRKLCPRTANLDQVFAALTDRKAAE